MANGTVALVGNDWVKFADGGMTAVSWQNQTSKHIYIQGTATDSKPSGEPGDGVIYAPLSGEVAMDAAELFSGVSGVSYLWAYVKGSGSPGNIWRSHA